MTVEELEAALHAAKKPALVRAIAEESFRRMVQFRAWALANNIDIRLTKGGVILDKNSPSTPGENITPSPGATPTQ